MTSQPITPTKLVFERMVVPLHQWAHNLTLAQLIGAFTNNHGPYKWSKDKICKQLLWCQPRNHNAVTHKFGGSTVFSAHRVLRDGYAGEVKQFFDKSQNGAPMVPRGLAWRADVPETREGMLAHVSESLTYK